MNKFPSINRLIRRTPVVDIQLPNGCNVFFKMENLQYSGSFKDRGISHMIQSLQLKHSVSKLISSSGGNAGYAVAVAGAKLGIPVDVFVPKTTLPLMIAKLKASKANVIVGGDNWNEADKLARERLQTVSGAQYIPPFDHPLIWEGNASLIDELQSQIPTTPDVIIASVGGGGLLRGLQLGMLNHNWHTKTKVLGVETTGAASFAAAKAHGKTVRLEKIDTIATTLGALEVTSSVMDPQINSESVVVTDKQAVHACLQFADEYRQIVEPSCGASLSLFYDPSLASKYFLPNTNVVVIVCGGSAVSLELLQFWKNKFSL